MLLWGKGREGVNLPHIIYAVVCLVCLLLLCGKREATPV